MKKVIKIIIAFLLVAGVLSVAGYYGIFRSRIKLISPIQGDITVSIVNKDIQSFLDEKYTNETCEKYYMPDVMHYEPEYVTFSWKGNATELILSERSEAICSIGA